MQITPTLTYTLNLTQAELDLIRFALTDAQNYREGLIPEASSSTLLDLHKTSAATYLRFHGELSTTMPLFPEGPAIHIPAFSLRAACGNFRAARNLPPTEG